MDIGLIRMRYTPYGGAEAFLSSLIEGLRRRGHECHLIATGWSRSEPGLKVHKVRAASGPSFLKVITFAIGAGRLSDRLPLDVVIGLDRTLGQDIYRAGDGCHREWLLKRRRLLSPSRYATLWINPLHLAILYVEGRLFKSRRLKAVIANSQMVKGDIMRHYGLPEEKIHVIYNGIDLSRFDPKLRDEGRRRVRERLGLGSGEVLLLFLGSGFERKGLGPLIEALSILRKRGERVRLAVVGKGRYRTYRGMVERLGLEGDVAFIGPREDVRDYYYGSDIFVLPSLYEPFSNACLEAMAAGLPVVTSRSNGVSEIIEDGREGMVLDDPLSPDLIAEAILPLLERDRRVEMGRLARERAEALPVEAGVERILQVVEKVVGG